MGINVDDLLQLVEFEKEMTMARGDGEVPITVPGAKKAFDDFCFHYGLTGIKTLYGAGYTDPQKLLGFYNECNGNVSQLTRL